MPFPWRGCLLIGSPLLLPWQHLRGTIGEWQDKRYHALRPLQQEIFLTGPRVSLLGLSFQVVNDIRRDQLSMQREFLVRKEPIEQEDHHPNTWNPFTCFPAHNGTFGDRELRGKLRLRPATGHACPFERPGKAGW